MTELELASAQALVDSDILSTSEAGPAAIRGGTLRLLSFFAASLFSVGAAALLYRHLGLVSSGQYTDALVLAAIITGFTDLGLTAIGMRELAVLRGTQRAELARKLLGMRLVITLAGTLIVSAFAFATSGRLIGFGVLIAGGGVLLQNTQNTLAVPLMARLRLGWVSILDFVRQLTAACTIVLLVLLGAGVLPFLAVVAAAALVVLPPTIALVRSDIPIMPSFDVRRWRALLAPVLTYSLAVAAATLYFRVAVVLVSLVSSAHQLGYFSVSYRIVEFLSLLPSLLVGAAFPIFARAAHDDPERFGYAVSRVFEVSLILGAWISLSLAFGSSFVIALIGGAGFKPAAPVLAIQGLAVGAAFVSAVWAYGLLSLHLHRTILIFNTSLLLLMAGVVAILASTSGAEGAAAGTAAVEIVAASLGVVLLMRGRPHLRPSFRVLPKVALAGLAGSAPALLSDVPAIGCVALSTVIYALVLLLLKAVPRDLLHLLPRRWEKAPG